MEAEHIKYAIRLPANQVLQNRIGYLLKSPIGGPKRSPSILRELHLPGTWCNPCACNRKRRSAERNLHTSCLGLVVVLPVPMKRISNYPGVIPRSTRHRHVESNEAFS